MPPRNLMLDGAEKKAAEPFRLRSGPLSLVFQPGEAFLRYIRYGDHEILRGIYVAVRDRNWNTIVPDLSNLCADSKSDSFRISFDAECREREIDFFWKGVIEGETDGKVTFSMEGAARSTFWRNRIGLCVLHPIRECAGKSCVVESVDGGIHETNFPYDISPHQPFRDLRAIRHQVIPGLTAEVRFEGDAFETEDQRNWTDASYKTYCTPLNLPFPVEIKKSTEIKQKVILRVLAERSVQVAARFLEASECASQRREIFLNIDHSSSFPMPRIGLGLGSCDRPLDCAARDRLRTLKLSHLRIALELWNPPYIARLERAAAEAKMLDTRLEAAIFLTDQAEQELAQLAAILRKLQPPIYAWLIFHRAEKTTTTQWVELARRALSEFDRSSSIGSGTDVYFAELNRERPAVAVSDLICYSINPQVHAFDNTSLIETLEIQAWTVRRARRFGGHCRIAVTPITLKPRFNPNVAGAEPDQARLPAEVDVRQMSLFGACWTVGSLKYLCEAGADSVTYYEATGPCGVMEAVKGSPWPEKFPSTGGCVFPVYHVFADAGEFARGRAIKCASSAPLQVEGIALQDGNQIRVLIANLSPQLQHVRVQGLTGWSGASVKSLDETNADAAMQFPEAFRRHPGILHPVNDGSLDFELLPHGLTRLDSRRESP